MSTINHFVVGAIGMGFWIAGLAFLRFWRRSHDPFFVFFAVAFWLMALIRLGLSYFHDVHERHAQLCLLRLFAFLLILGAIIHKNWDGPRRK